MDFASAKAAVVMVLDGGGVVQGTGFLATSEGQVLTCWHVVEQLSRIRVRFEDESAEIPAVVRLDLSDAESDIAVLQLDAPPGREPVRFGGRWAVGDRLWSYGYQYREYFSTGYPVDGTISGDTHIRSQQLIVVSNTDVQRGLSGAPVFQTATGRVVAMINAKFDDKGIGFAIPMTIVGRRWPAFLRILGAAEDRLRTSVANLLRAIGYKVEPDPYQSSGDQAFISAHLKVGPTEIKLLVLCLDLDSAADAGQFAMSVHALVRLAAQHRYEKSMVVTSAPSTAAAAQLAASLGVQLLTYGQLTAELIDFSEYVDSVVHDYEHFDEYYSLQNYPIIEYFRWCDLHRYYVDLHAVDPSSSRRFESALSALQGFIEDDAHRHLSILGDYGTGKTSLCLQLTYDLARRYQADPVNNRIPIFLALRNFDIRGGLRRFIVDSLVEYGIKIMDYRSFEIMLKSGRFVLILDGFDEMADSLDRQGALQAFNQLAQLVTPASKAILTCRTHYFRSESQSMESLTVDTMTPLMREVHSRRTFQIMELLKFDEQQVLDLISRHTDDSTVRWEQMKSIYNLADLARTPILLNIIINSLERLFTLRNRREIRSASLYDIYTQFWLERDDERSSVTTTERRLFAEELAWRMYETDSLSIPNEELKTSVNRFFSAFYQRGGEWFEQLDTNVRTCSFLARDRYGNYLFAHKSFMEFFVAKKLARMVREWPSADLWARIVPFEIVSFLQDLLSSEDMQLIKAMSVDRQNDELLRSLCMDIQIGVGDTVKDEPMVLRLTYDTTGRVLASANADCSVRLWSANDAQPIRLIRQLEGHEDWVRSVAFSANGRYLATGGWDNRILLWSLPEYDIVRTFDTDERINSVRFSRDSALLFSGGYDQVLSMWDVGSGQLLRQFAGHYANIRSIVTNPTDRLVFTAGLDKTIRVWSLNDPERPPVISVQEEPVTCIEISPDGRYLASGTWTGELTLWDAVEMEVVRTFRGHANMVNSLAFSPDGTYFASCSDDREVRVWNCPAARLVQAFVAGSDFVSGLAYSPDGRQLAAGGYDSTLSVWQTDSWTLASSVRIARRAGSS